jgi:CO/xanthine dehydrogenase Mo-binding subunit
MDGPAPAIVNAVEDALGVRFDSIPLLPENIMDGLAELPLESDVVSRLGGR